MRRPLPLSLPALAAALLALAAPAAAQGTYETYTGWAVPTEPVLPAEEAHPQLWFGEDGLAALRDKWDDPANAELVARVVDEIDDYKRRAASATDPGDRAQMAKAMAFAWIIDDDVVGFVKGVEALRLAYQNVPQTAVGSSFDGEFDEIYRATWLQNFCAAYDWLHPSLSEADRAAAREAIAAEAALLADNMVSGVGYAPRPHNHRSKPAYALGTAALTLSDHPDAAAWLRLALEQQNTTTRYQFSADGVYREGSHYWVYVLVNAVPFLWQYRHAGQDLFPAYQPTFEWAVRVRTGRGWLPALEDGFPKPAPTHMVAAAYADAPTALHPTAPLAEVLQWNWQTTDFFQDNYTGATRDVLWAVDEFLTADPAIPATPPGVSPTQRVESGQVVLRSDWNAGDPGTRHLLFHGVASADNHDHPDLLSYALDAENTPLAVDAGYGPGGFSDDRRAWYTSARAHNVVTVDGFPVRDVSLQRNEGPEQTAFVDGPAFDAGEMRAPNNGVQGGATVTRGVAMLDDRYYAVYDHVEAGAEASLQVHLHGRGAPARADNRVVWSAPDDPYGDGGDLHATFVADGPLRFDESDGWTSFYFSREEDQRWVAARRNADAATFLHTLVATPPGGAAPETTDRSAGDLVAVELTLNADDRWVVATQRDPAPRAAGALATDAAMAAVGAFLDAPTRWGVVRGAALAWDGRDLLAASAPLTASADARDPRRQTLTVAPGDAARTVTLGLVPATANAVAVTLGAEPLGYEVLGGGRIRFVVPAAGGTVAVATDAAVSAEPEAAALALGLAAHPNPFAARVHLGLDVPAPGPARVAVYDALGRRVRTLADGPLAAGAHALAWDGRTDGGAPAPSGVYTAVAEAAGAVARVRLTLLR